MKILAVIAAMLALGVEGSAAAEPQSPSTYNYPNAGDVNIPEYQENLNAREVREGMIKFARCLAGRHGREANDFVMNNDQDSWSALEKKMDEDCVLDAVKDPNGEVTVSTNSRDLLFALAEVLVQKRLAAIDPAAIAAAPPLAPGPQSVGECAVRGNPVAARNFLGTRINSKEEVAAAQAIAPAFGHCVSLGAELRPDMTTLRGNVAVYYYRLGSAPLAHSGASKSERGK